MTKEQQTDKPERLTLHQKILKIADMAGVLQKSKDGYSYKYVPEEDIQAKVTAGLQKYGVMLYNSIVPGTMKVTPYQYEKYDQRLKGLKPVNEIIVSGEMTYTWVDVDNPEDYKETTWGFVGQMEDAAQAMGAGLTYANRYYLMKQLQLATTESDPDNYRSKQKKAEAYEEDMARKEAEEELNKNVQEVVAAGLVLINNYGVTKAQVMKTVASANDGNGNPSSIKDIVTCKKVLDLFEQLKKNTAKNADGKDE